MRHIPHFILFVLIFIYVKITFSAEYRPVFVYTSAETLRGHDIEKINDGLLSTTVCLLDDSRTGKNTETVPVNGSSPVTATLVLDLGQKRAIRGVRLTAKNTVAAKMAQMASIFVCNDPEGKTNVRFLLENVELPAVIYSHSAFLVLPKPVEVRYLGIRIDNSYERPNNFPVIPRNKWFQKSFREIQEEFGYDTSGKGNHFFTEIAEITAFDTIPIDYGKTNKPKEAFPLARLHRDWIYRDFGMDYSKTIDFMDEKKMREYFDQCFKKRIRTLKSFVELAETNRFIYVKHTVIGGGTMLGATEYLTDTQYEDPNPDQRPGS